MALARGLLIATLIFAVVGVILIAIALATDNWKCFTVDSNLLERAFLAQPNNANRNNQDYDVTNDRKYYSRNYGFFRECYPDRVPDAVYRNGVGDQGNLTRVIGTYRSPHGTRCVNSFPGFKKQNGMGLRTKEYVNMKIAYISLYSIGLFIAVLALLFMCIGIGVKKGIPVIFTGFSFLLAAIFLAAAIGVWHKSNDELATITNFSELADDNSNSQYYKNSYNSNLWDGEGSSTPIRDGTVENFCWSYYIAWIGIALLFLTAIISCCLTMVIAQERKVSRNRKYQDMMGVSGSVMQMGQAYGGGGGGNEGGHGGQIYATGGSEKAIMPSYATGGDSGAYANYGYAGQQQYGQYPQGYNYGNMGDYMGYYNPFATMGR